MPASPRTRLARLNPENGPTSSLSTATRRRSMRNRSRERRCWKRGWRARRSGAARLRLWERPSAVDEHRRGQHLRQLFGRLARRVPQIEGDTGPAATVEEAGNRRVAVGPVHREDRHAGLAERVTDVVTADRGGGVDLAGQAEDDREI